MDENHEYLQQDSGDKKDNRTMSVLCYIRRDGCYLMMHRIVKKNDLNEGKWIGVGGHFKEGESPEECLLREVREETGLFLTQYQMRGIITFHSDRWGWEYMFLYTADEYDGDDDLEKMGKCAGREGILEWVPTEKVTDLNLWEGDRIFLDLLPVETGFFSLKLVYRGDDLEDWILKRYGEES